MAEDNNQPELNENLFEDFTPVSYDEWKTAAEKALKGAPFDSKMLTKTYEDITLKPIYRQEELGEGVFADSMPGSVPFVRASKVDGYIEKPWLISQECNQATTKAVNEILKKELGRGLQTIHLHLDIATQLGLDPNTAKPEQVGESGVSISILKDIEELFADLDFSSIPLRAHAGIAALPLLSLIGAIYKKQKIDSKNMEGCLGADPLGMLAQSGSLDEGLSSLYDQMAATVAWADKNAPKMRTILIDVSCYHNAGANAVQELAFAIATAVEYVKQMLKRDLKFSQVAKHLQFSFSLGANMFMELSKVRAMRLLWSQVCSAYGEENTDCAANIHVRTSYFTKTIYDPYVNLLRATTESFAGAVGGVDSMHVGPLDEIVRHGDDFSRRIARNIQIMLQGECNLLQPIDPAGGSWYIETLTEDLARKAWELFTKVEDAGGMLAALKKELLQREAAGTFAKRMSNLGKRKNVVVGTNNYANLGEKLLEPDAGITDKQRKERIKQIVAHNKTENNGSRVTKLSDLEKKIHDKDAGVVDAAIDAALDGCTLGEIFLALQQDGDEATVIKPLDMKRNSELFENLRQATETYVQKTGDNVRIFSANMGPIPQHKARADFSRSFFEVGAFQVLGNDGFKTVEEAAEAASKEKADVVVICSTDKTYPELVPPLAKLLKEKLPSAKVFLAGQAPEDMKKSIWRRALTILSLWAPTVTKYYLAYRSRKE